MSQARRWAVGSIGAIAALVAAPAPSAVAEDGRWEMLRWGIEEGAAVIGQTWTIAGTISAPMPTDVITSVEVILERVGPAAAGCPNFSRSFPAHEVPPGLFPDDGDDGPGTTSTTDPSSTTTNLLPLPERYDEFRFRYTVVPRCNGLYHLSVVGTSTGFGGEETESEQLYLGDPGNDDDAISVGLSPPDVTRAVAAVDSARTVAIAFEPPAEYAPDIGGPPPDLAGYIIEYRLDQGPWKEFIAVGPATFHAAHPLPSGEPAGNYQFMVRGARQTPNTDLSALAEGGPTAITPVVAVGAAPPPPATETTRRPSSGGRGVPQQGPNTTYDGGFSEEIDYSELLEEGDEEPTLPDDAASFLDFVPESTGSAILVPFAIAECLAVWALHLRYLARRVDGG